MPTAIHHLASSQRTCMISASISSLSRHSPLESTLNFKIGSVSSVAEVEISLALLKCSWYAPEMLLVSEPFERDQPPFITHLSCLSPPPVHPDSLAERILHIREHIIFHSLGYHLQEDIITEVYHHFAFKSSLASSSGQSKKHEVWSIFKAYGYDHYAAYWILTAKFESKNLKTKGFHGDSGL